jgi:recombinational DNA repair protein (RecF pathway)
VFSRLCTPSTKITAVMALRETEAIVLRTYPMREADLLVTLFTRGEGKVR